MPPFTWRAQAGWPLLSPPIRGCATTGSAHQGLCHRVYSWLSIYLQPRPCGPATTGSAYPGSAASLVGRALRGLATWLRPYRLYCCLYYGLGRCLYLAAPLGGPDTTGSAPTGYAILLFEPYPLRVSALSGLATTGSAHQGLRHCVIPGRAPVWAG